MNHALLHGLLYCCMDCCTVARFSTNTPLVEKSLAVPLFKWFDAATSTDAMAVLVPSPAHNVQR